MRFQEKIPNCWRCDFFDSAQTVMASRENALHYDEGASGPTHYNINRDYDPATGRYLQSDPIGLAGGSYSTYSYVGNNPLGYFDLSGLKICKTTLPGIGDTYLDDSVDPRVKDFIKRNDNSNINT